jgi:hypothetical protein
MPAHRSDRGLITAGTSSAGGTVLKHFRPEPEPGPCAHPMEARRYSHQGGGRVAWCHGCGDEVDETAELDRVLELLRQLVHMQYRSEAVDLLAEATGIVQRLAGAAMAARRALPEGALGPVIDRALGRGTGGAGGRRPAPDGGVTIAADPEPSPVTYVDRDGDHWRQAPTGAWVTNLLLADPEGWERRFAMAAKYPGEYGRELADVEATYGPLRELEPQPTEADAYLARVCSPSSTPVPEVERLRAALEIIAGRRPRPDGGPSNGEIARRALDA